MLKMIVMFVAFLGLMPFARAHGSGLNWKVGDQVNYKFSSPNYKGTLTSFVRDDNGSELWVQQEADLRNYGKSKTDIFYDKATGQVKKIVSVGKEMPIPDRSSLELLETKKESITVTAGTFQATYTKWKNKLTGAVVEVWTNDVEVPMGGLIKEIDNNPDGTLTLELTAKSFAP